MLTKVVYNTCYGGFSVSPEAWTRMKELGYKDEFYAFNGYVYLCNCARHDPVLVQVVEELGKKVNGLGSDLRIAEVFGPYRIEEYDGFETVIEPDDYEWITP